VDYGFVPRAMQALRHPRSPRKAWTPTRTQQALAVLAYVHARGVVHPREVDAHFAHGRVRTYALPVSAAAKTHTLLEPAFTRATTRLACTTLDGVTWYWPPAEKPQASRYHPP
jgi:hypothetical protein